MGERQRIAEVLLGGGGATDVALVDDERGAVGYAELRRLVEHRRGELSIERHTDGARGVVLLSGRPSVEWIVTYLAILQGGHVPLLAGPRQDALERAWSPVLAVDVGDEVRIRRGDRCGGPAPVVLHPDLALLLSTSGSTGSPKLVRLSHHNLSSNALAIARSLGLGARDRGITTLPLHYCFGLSVLHSHLAVGASVAVTQASVVDPCFVRALEEHRVTSLAGVPHTFDLLEAAGAERLATPWLRLVTQAGGRLAEDAAVRWRERCAAWGVDLVVMYGQTEATARMAYLPPARAATAGPRAVGIPIPGGSLTVEACDDAEPGTGELVYRGPNVMMGYGEEPADLALGPSLHELRTGDLGRYDPVAGVFEVVGRRSRFTKPFGLRIDLDAVEAGLRSSVDEVAVGGDDDLLVVVAPGADREELVAAAADLTGLPSTAIVGVTATPIPRTAVGKVDQAALRALASAPPSGDGAAPDVATVSDVLAEVLGRPALEPSDTFVSAGGDSLSYVEASLRVERLVGTLPEDWQHRTMADLDALGPGSGSLRVDTTVVLRAIGICTVVATHMHVARFPGGAHVLLAVAGYNLSRFNLDLPRARDRLRAMARTVARVAVPTVLVAVTALTTTDRYDRWTVLLLNGYLGPRHHQHGHWHFWFVEAFVQLGLLATALLAVPPVRRAERRWPYGFVLALLGGALALRTVTWWGIDDPLNLRFRTHGVAGFFVLGWLVHRSSTRARKLVTTAACLVTVLGFFDLAQREWFIIGCLVTLLWAPRIAVPRALVPVVSTVASASMWILITHFHLWPPLADRLPLPVAYVATIVAGVLVWALVDRGPRVRRARVRRRRPTPPRPTVPSSPPSPVVPADAVEALARRP